MSRSSDPKVTDSPEAIFREYLFDVRIVEVPGDDSDATMRVALADAPDGLAGYEVTLELEGGTAVGADYPEAFQPTTDPAVSADGQPVTLEAADLQDAVAPGDADVTLATVDVADVAGDVPAVELADAQIDADGGEKIDPATVTVTLAGSDEAGSLRQGGDAATRPQQGGENETATTGEDGPGFGVLAALVALLAVALGSRRV